jgi:hypothetical protein
VSTPIDALRLVPSVEVRERGPRGVQADFAIRGAAFGQALVLVNGARLNDAQSGTTTATSRVAARRRAHRGAARRRRLGPRRGRGRRRDQRHHAPRRPRFASDIAVGQHDLVEAAPP